MYNLSETRNMKKIDRKKKENKLTSEVFTDLASSGKRNILSQGGKRR